MHSNINEKTDGLVRRESTQLAKASDFKPYSENLSVRSMEYLVAYKAPKLSELKPIVIKDKIDEFIEAVFYEIGDRGTTSEDKEMLCRVFYTEVTKQWPMASLEDIKLALQNGVRGEYTRKIFITAGDSGLSLMLLHSWVKDFFTSKERLAVVNRQKAFEDNSALTADQKRKAANYAITRKKNIETFCSAYNESLNKRKFLIVKAKDHILDLTNVFVAQYWYNYFTKAEMLVIPDEQKIAIWEKVRKELQSKFESNVTLNAFDRVAQGNRAVLSTIPLTYKAARGKFAEFSNSQRDMMEEIKRHAQSRSVRDFLENCLNNQENLTFRIDEYEKKFLEKNENF